MVPGDTGFTALIHEQMVLQGRALNPTGQIQAGRFTGSHGFAVAPTVAAGLRPHTAGLARVWESGPEPRYFQRTGRALGTCLIPSVPSSPVKQARPLHKALRVEWPPGKIQP